MTVIKQKAVTENGHAKNLRNYINDPRALLRSFQNIGAPARWADEMNRVREACGHNQPSRSGAANTILYHQVLAFLCEDLDLYDGPMTPESCMEYAREYVLRRYPDHQVAFALHKEHCREDGTDRYAVHMAINRTNLATGKRLDEGLGYKGKRARAATVRDMDGKWGLHQVEKGVENSQIHKRQPQRTGVEKQILDRAAKQGRAPEEASYKYNLRELCRGLRKKARSMEEYRSLLHEWGVASEVKGGKLYVTDMDNNTYSFRVSRLDRALEENALEEVFARNAGNTKMEALEAEVREAEKGWTDYQAARASYLKTVEQCYREYRQEARQAKGAPPDRFPRLRLPRIPQMLAKDAEVRRAVLGYIGKSDELRSKLASVVTAEAGRQAEQKRAQAKQQERETRNRTKER